MDKRQQILEAATKLFAMNGYTATSMQQIADEIGISKGSVYFYFPSKEDLIISIYEHYQQIVFERSFVVSLQKELSTEEKLIKQFSVQFEGMFEYRSYMIMHMRGEGPKNNEKIKGLEHRMRGRFFSWLNEAIYDLFGDEITPYKWDLLWMSQSLYTAYMTLYLSEDHEISSGDLARHMVTHIRMYGEVYLKGESKPLLDHSKMEKYFVKKDKQGSFVQFEEREKIWKRLVDEIISHSLPLELQKELLACVEKISVEIKKEKPDKLIVKALFNMITQESSLKKTATQLYKLL
ncbi:TetR/AcrR family transcriptional regulator [Bacillus coahuilensis]|uniref:TetR/AcrR family transcriptional regulator n=1 Tax=Bacillus coahuilensis TaxID=408580 RepID=UPI0001850EF2|nr:TetR/AcrR family transcriptional regulator [Bacillus coahuilensis]